MKTRPNQTVVGVDAGGSTTRAVVLTLDGDCIGFTTAGSGNPTSAGLDAAAAEIVAAIRGAREQAGADAPLPRHAAIAMAGASQHGGDWIAGALGRGGIPIPSAIEADLAAVYLSGSLAPLGYAAIAGTGAIAARLIDGRIDAVADGLGWLLGDDGSGFAIGHAVARAVAAEFDGRGPATAMTSPALERLGIDPERFADAPRDDAQRPPLLGELLRRIYGRRPVELAALAPVAFTAAVEGDAVAGAIVAGASQGLAHTLATVVRTGDAAPVVLGGSVLASQPLMADGVHRALRESGVTGEVITVRDGVVGAAVLALRGAGVDVDDRTRRRIGSSLERLRPIG